jgi:hypothetical protein
MLSFESAAKLYINELIFNFVKGVVITGPFKGMQILEKVAWMDGNLGTKILGCYEQELHHIIEEEIARLKNLDMPPIILDIGCSEGYYAVGMALRLPDAKVMAIDASEEALRITQAAADVNEVLIDTIHTNDLQSGNGSFKFNLYEVKPDLVICDCEGGEMDYIDPGKFPGLKEAYMLVECHDTQNLPITQAMADRFDSTHDIYVITEGGRDPNQFELLRGLPSLIRWLAVSEGRPCMMHWLWMKPKS